ncbi:hypothetical protein HZC35_01550 [Candidatus Saganbacteria bacterium]|nr:hypothetical protein [Candidatus Saganbacteria bacterium]
MKKSLVILALVLLASNAFAFQPEVVGGIRGGLAVGFMGESSIARNADMRFALEASTNENPVILLLGGKFYLTTIGRKVPLSLGAGAVGYAGGKKSEVGVAISFIFDRMFDVKPLFFEFGVDVAGSGKILAQFGYKLY